MGADMRPLWLILPSAALVDQVDEHGEDMERDPLPGSAYAVPHGYLDMRPFSDRHGDPSGAGVLDEFNRRHGPSPC